MLLLATTPAQAVSFLRTARLVIAKHRSTTDAQDRAAKLVVAACGLVRDPVPVVAASSAGMRCGAERLDKSVQGDSLTPADLTATV